MNIANTCGRHPEHWLVLCAVVWHSDVTMCGAEGSHQSLTESVGTVIFNLSISKTGRNNFSLLVRYPVCGKFVIAA